MTVEELIGNLWGLLEAWGPLVAILFAGFFALVLSFVVFVFVKVIRGMREMDADHRAMRKRMGR